MREGTVLVIRARNLKGRSVCTFPKGRIDKGETSQDAALREVEEETGWRCRIETELPRSQYWFQREGRRVKKTVRWFRMAPEAHVGQLDSEVEEVAWLPIDEARNHLTYRSDRDLLRRAYERNES